MSRIKTLPENHCTPADLAARLHTHPATIRRWLTGSTPAGLKVRRAAARIGGRWVIDAKQLAELDPVIAKVLTDGEVSPHPTLCSTDGGDPFVPAPVPLASLHEAIIAGAATGHGVPLANVILQTLFEFSEAKDGQIADAYIRLGLICIALQGAFRRIAEQVEINISSGAKDEAERAENLATWIGLVAHLEKQAAEFRPSTGSMQ